MARSRVGGTSGMLTGRVGDLIYSVTRNADGSFRQQAAFNDGIRENPNTDAQARARLTMATVERAMFTYRDFMGTGFEGVALGTNSVSKFSEVNYNAMKYEIDEYWDDPEWPDYNYDFPRKGQTSPKDGCFIISQGSLKSNDYILTQPASGGRDWFGIETQAIEPPFTVRKFLGRNGLKAGMQFVGIFFCQGTTPSKSFVAWLMFYTDESVRLDDVLTSSNWRNYIRTNSNVLLNAYLVPETGKLWLRCEKIASYGISRTGCMGKRLRIRDGNIYRYNNCEMMWACFPDPQTAWGWKTVGQVKNTWIDKPIPPTPTHRIPLEFQEVLYITSVDDIMIQAPINYNPSAMALEFSVLYHNYRSAYVFSQPTTDGILRFNTQVSQSRNILRLRSRKDSQNVLTTLNEIFDLNSLYRFKVWAENDQIAVDLNDVITKYTNAGVTESCSAPRLYIFGWSTYFTRCSIYEVVLRNTSTGSIIHDLVPCYRKSDGAIGFYDINVNAFYTADDSQTKMTYGPIVNPT